MAVILSSTIIADRVQADGRRYVTERHDDDQGESHRVTYLAASNADAQATANARQATILTQLRDHEIAANIAKALNGETTFTFRYSTVAQNRTALRETFRTATRWELLTLAWVIDGLNLSDNQLKLLFGVDDAGLPAVKTKLANMAAKYDEVQALIAQGGA